MTAILTHSTPQDWTGLSNWEFDPDPSSDTREIIDNSIVDNPGQPDGIWQLGVDKVLTDGEPINENRGQTYIRGQLYNVSDDGPEWWLNPSTGSQEYKI